MVTEVSEVIDLGKVCQDRQLYGILEELAQMALLYPVANGRNAAIESLSHLLIHNSTHRMEVVGGFADKNRIYLRLATRTEETFLPSEHCLAYVCDIPPEYMGEPSKPNDFTLAEIVVYVQN